MDLKAGQIIVFFLTFYLVFGLTNAVVFGTPNNTNDFVAHYYKTISDFYNPVVQEYYSIEFLEEYPQVFHLLAKPFALNEFGFYAFAIILVCLIVPSIVYKLSGDLGVIVYFALSLPHMIIYNATFPSFLIMGYVLVYLLNRKNFSLFLVLMWLSIFTHKHGLIVFLLIGFAELVQWGFLKFSFKNKFGDLKFNLGTGFLVGTKFNTSTQIVNMFLNHLNIYYLWVVRKKINLFFGILLFVSFYGAIFYDFRTIMLAQIIVCVLIGQTFKEQKPTKFFWFVTITFFVFNFFGFLLETQRFLSG